MIAKVVVDKLVYNLDKEYDYNVPDDIEISNLTGCRVTIPFGIGNNARLGFVTKVVENGESQNLKSIYTVIDKEPILDDEMLKIAYFLKERTFCTFFDALKCLVPSGFNFKVYDAIKFGSFNNQFSNEEVYLLDRLKTYDKGVKISDFCDDIGISKDGSLINGLIKNGSILKTAIAEQNTSDYILKTAFLNKNEIPGKLTKNQKAVYDYLKENNFATFAEIEDVLNISSSTVKTLENKGLVTIKDQEYLRSSVNYSDLKCDKIILTAEQDKVYSSLKSKYLSNKYNVSLLYGVTGSGKTSVFLKLVDRVIKDGKTAIVMVPEIALTPQTLKLFYARYKDAVAVFHSALSKGQRMDEYKRVKSGKVKVVVGTRSAIFAPLKNIGVIIIDEEQEHTYKSEQNPRFHARDVAKFRCLENNALLLLASATPSFESYALAKSGKYSFYELKERYGEAKLPEVITVDERNEIKNGNRGIYSERLIDEISETLYNNKQVILLLNRRGHNTYISCPSCGYVFNCQNCSISLTYHSNANKFMCHYCGAQHNVPQKCPICENERLRYSGYGTQKAVEELELLFPNARILRMDADSTSKKDSAERLLNDFSEHKYDILIGTQMVAKGLNFPNVTLVGVLQADNAMFFDDFRAYERAFSLFTQVFGRSGRGINPGKAIIQTASPENYVIKYAAAQDYSGFFEKEISVRKLMTYPPYCDIVVLGFVSNKKDLSIKAAKFALNILKEKSSQYNDVKFIALGPTPANVPVVSNKYRYRIILKTKNSKRFREFLNEIVNEFYISEKQCNLFIDINPESMI